MFFPINMAEVIIGTAASVLTLALTAFDTSKLLYEAVTSFKSRRKISKTFRLTWTPSSWCSSRSLAGSKNPLTGASLSYSGNRYNAAL